MLRGQPLERRLGGRPSRGIVLVVWTERRGDTIRISPEFTVSRTITLR